MQQDNPDQTQGNTQPSTRRWVGTPRVRVATTVAGVVVALVGWFVVSSVFLKPYPGAQVFGLATLGQLARSLPGALLRGLVPALIWVVLVRHRSGMARRVVAGLLVALALLLSGLAIPWEWTPGGLAATMAGFGLFALLLVALGGSTPPESGAPRPQSEGEEPGGVRTPASERWRDRAAWLASLLTLPAAAASALFLLATMAGAFRGDAGLRGILLFVALAGLQLLLGPPALVLALLSRRWRRVSWILLYFGAVLALSLTYQARGEHWGDRVRESVEHARYRRETRLARVLSAKPIDSARVGRLIKEGVDVNRKLRTRWGAFPIMKAVEVCDLEVVTMLLDAGADPDPDPRWTSPLVRVTWNSPCSTDEANAAVVGELLEHGARADLMAADDHRTALMAAAGSGRTATVAVLLEHGATVRPVGPRRETALHFSRKPEIVRQLLAAGADPNARDALGETALFAAAKMRGTELLEALLAGGADARIADTQGLTPLHVAATPAAVRALLLAGADLEATCPRYGTPLVKAVADRRTEMVGVLLDAGADIAGGGNRALHSVEDTETCALLLARGADPNARDMVGLTPLMRHLRQRDLALTLINAGADLEARDRFGESIRHRADGPSVPREVVEAIRAREPGR